MKDDGFYGLIICCIVIVVFICAIILDDPYVDRTYQYKVIDKRETAGSHFSIANKGVRTDYNLTFKRIDNGRIFSCEDVDYEDYVQYQLNRNYTITEYNMKRLSGVFNEDFYK